MNKQYVMRIFFIGELLIFAGFYCLGSNGVTALMHIKKDINGLTAQVEQLKMENQKLISTVALQKKHPFFQEKKAREQLQMARAKDEIYIYNS